MIIYISPITVAMINSEHARTKLLSLHPTNVSVLRHPASFPLYWSHHQKVYLLFVGEISQSVVIILFFVLLFVVIFFISASCAQRHSL